MIRRLLKITASLFGAIFFLWLAFRGVDFQDLGKELSEVKTDWILPFSLVMLISHYLRAERWRLLLGHEGMLPARSTLFAGVMTGYLMNAVLPRLGEITRPVYVGRQTGLTTGNLLGTIVLERVIDLASMLLLMLFAALWLIGDPEPVQRILGTESWNQGNWYWVPAVAGVVVLVVWGGLRLLGILKEKLPDHPLLLRVSEFGSLFWQGLLSIRSVKNWPLFILYTAGIWLGYTGMAWFPFWMLDLHTVYGLGFPEAVVVTVISAVGVAVPVPGGIGSYHLLVQQSLWHLYGVPMTTALTYAAVTHATTLLFTFLLGAAALWFDKYDTLKKKRVR